MSNMEPEIDDSLYSRQRYVLGDGAMKRMAKSNVLLCGLGGLGIEIAKNIVLAGVKSLTILDPAVATNYDLGLQFFLTEDDVQKQRNRAEASQSKLAELNPYVSIKTRTDVLDASTDLTFLADYQCVIVTELSLEMQLKINSFCRSQATPIKFITGDVYGVMCWTFCDFGNEFEVVDTDGEEPKDAFISSITKENPGVVTTLENRMHGFQDGDHVTFKEVHGMEGLNGKTFPIKVLTPYTFSICDTSGSDYSAYQHGGIATQVKVPKVVSFKSLEEQWKDPTLLCPDFSKLEAPQSIHLAMIALHKFRSQRSRLPNVWCSKEAQEMVDLAKQANGELANKVETIDENIVKNLSYTSQGSLAPLCAALGGFMAQEVLKAVTGKFMPLNQWLLLDACEVLADLESLDSSTFQHKNNRYDALRACVGEDVCQKLADLRLFMVGCGAIGCEMLKNYALLGIGSTNNGQITITDNDLIEKSNLNRQFLFRPHHIRQPKSTTAAESVGEINPHLKIDPQQYKVCPQTEDSIYTDSFFESQNVIVNALDNVEARRYMDSRCVTNGRPLLESGTMGAKGHVQTVIPHLTESYSNQRDPVDHDVPYCTLKSFPAAIEHCIQWARDKFESSFAMKPSAFNKFWLQNELNDVCDKLRQGIPLEGVEQVTKLTTCRPLDWPTCVKIAREKFEKYFNHKAKNLLHAFPLDTKLNDGSLFWQSPKRPPIPQEFNSKNELSMAFVQACARLYADMNKVTYTEKDIQEENMMSLLADLKVKEFRPSNKQIVTDESVSKPVEPSSEGDDSLEAADRLKQVMDNGNQTLVCQQMMVHEFEKDDDSNGHIDFITAASNLRAAMYNIEPADRLKTKRIAGRIVPAIATTTACVAGLVTVELIKIVKKAPLEHYKNCFLNLAIPVIVFSEPAPAPKTALSTGVTYTAWDRWEVKGKKEYTLTDFMNYFKENHGMSPSMVVQGTKMVYVDMMPGHKKRLTQLMTKLVKLTSKGYVDLMVGYQAPLGQDEDEMGPPVRYYFCV